MRSKKHINLLWISFITYGIIFSLVAVSDIFESRKSKAWPAVDGVIIVSKLNKRVRASRGSAALLWSTEINYSYLVNGNIYIGDMVRPGWDETSDRDEAINVRNKYKVETIVDVFYNPKKYSESVLDPSPYMALGSWVGIIVPGPGCLIMGLIILIYRKELMVEQ